MTHLNNFTLCCAIKLAKLNSCGTAVIRSRQLHNIVENTALITSELHGNDKP